MRKTTRLRRLIESPRILVMPGAYDMMTARLIEEAGFQAVQATGLGISAVHIGMPDYSVLSMTDMVEHTRRIVDSVSLPVMGDGDTGFGNAVNAHFTVRAFERAGAAGVNLEDQVMPKRCGHLEGKRLVPLDEAVAKIQAAADARKDPDFVINARTDALAVEGIEGVVRRGNAYLRAGATSIFVDGMDSVEHIRGAVKGIDGPVGMNMIEGGKTPLGLTFAQLERLGIRRVSLPLTALLASMHAFRTVLARIRANGGAIGYDEMMGGFADLHRLIGMEEVYALERKYLAGLLPGPGRSAGRARRPARGRRAR